MLQNWVGNEIGWGFDPLTSFKYKLSILSYFGNKKEIPLLDSRKDKKIEKMKREFLNKTLKSESINAKINQIG